MCFSTSLDLFLSTLATLNNLTYYPADTENKDQQDLAIFKRIQTYIDCSNIEAQIESSRVLGNLTRSRVIRDLRCSLYRPGSCRPDPTQHLTWLCNKLE